jgi:hypothetical protein
MDECKRLAVQFLEKEIKTYIALALFLSKEGIKERVQVGDKKVVISSTYYKERMREARKLVNELRNRANVRRKYHNELAESQS